MVNRSLGWWSPTSNNILSSMSFIQRRCRADVRTIDRLTPRQAGCMAKGKKRRKAARLPKQIDVAISAAEEKQALNLVVLDLRKAGGFTDYFILASGSNARHIRAIADS